MLPLWGRRPLGKHVLLLNEEQQSQIQINIVVEDEASNGGGKDAKGKGGFMGIEMTMLQGKEIPSNRAYLDNCSTVTAFKTAKYIRNIKTKKGNAGELQRWEHKDKPDELMHGTCQRL